MFGFNSVKRNPPQEEKKPTHLATEICGICHGIGGDEFWPNHLSDFAHKSCSGRIVPLEAELLETIKLRYHSVEKKLAAHTRALHELDALIGDCTVYEYRLLHGEPALKALFAKIAGDIRLQHRHSKL